MGSNEHSSHFFHHFPPTWAKCNSSVCICSMTSLELAYALCKPVMFALSLFQPIRAPHRLCSSGHVPENFPLPVGSAVSRLRLRRPIPCGFSWSSPSERHRPRAISWRPIAHDTVFQWNDRTFESVPRSRRVISRDGARHRPSIASRPLPETVNAGPRESEILRLEINNLADPNRYAWSYFVLASDNSLRAVRRNTSVRMRGRALPAVTSSCRAEVYPCSRQRNSDVAPQIPWLFFQTFHGAPAIYARQREDFTRSPVSTA